MKDSEVLQYKFRKLALFSSINFPLMNIIKKEKVMDLLGNTISDNNLSIQFINEEENSTCIISIEFSEQEPRRLLLNFKEELKLPAVFLCGQGVSNNEVKLSPYRMDNPYGFYQSFAIKNMLKFNDSPKKLEKIPSEEMINATLVGGYYLRRFLDEHKDSSKPPFGLSIPIVIARQPPNKEFASVASMPITVAQLDLVWPYPKGDESNINAPDSCSVFLYGSDETVFEDNLNSIATRIQDLLLNI